jgi:coenzyme F420-0:L-glutamate ligase/coenzyme F420-1:gamma-L-glutamate ligase
MVQIIGLRKIPLVKRDDNIGDLIVKAAKEEGLQILDHDIIVVAQKIVSKAEGDVIHLKDVNPSPLAERVAVSSGKDPRHVETILRESASILRMAAGHLIVETRHGFVCANAGVDRSNAEDQDSVVLLPKDPDLSARGIKQTIQKLTGANVGVIISDTFGRAWRIGQVNVAIGVAGFQPILDYRGSKDMFGYLLNVTQMAIADELASAAELVMKKYDRVPVAVIRGVEYPQGDGSAKDLIRPKQDDLFR